MGFIQNISLRFTGSMLLLVAAALVLTLYAVWIYRYTLPPVRRPLRFMLAGLRSAVFILLALLLFLPMIYIEYSSYKKAAVAVLLDGTESMRIAENGTTRGESLIQAAGTISDLLSVNHQVDIFQFTGDSLTQIKMADLKTLAFSGLYTDISAAITSLSDRQDLRDYKAVFLLTDGAYNRGRNPVQTAGKLLIPLYTVSIGNPDQKSDCFLNQVLTNETVFAGDSVPVNISYAGPGFDGEQATFRLIRDGRVLASKMSVIPHDGLASSVQLYFRPDTAGVVRIVAEMSCLDGELTCENNAQLLQFTVLPEKLHICVLAGAPGPDAMFIKRALEQDTQMKVLVRTQKGRHGFYEGHAPWETADPYFDLLVLIDIPNRSTTDQSWMMIRRLIEEQQLPLLVFAGRGTDDSRLMEIQSLLPIVSAERGEVRAVNPEAGNDAATMALMTLDRVDGWHQLPPVYSNWRNVKPRPETRILVRGVRGGHSSDEIYSVPLICLRYHMNEKCIIFLGDGFFRWFLAPVERVNMEPFFEEFLHDMVRWLSIRGSRKTLRINTSKPVYSAGEPVFIQVQAYDNILQPLTDASVHASVSSKNIRHDITLVQQQKGLYVGSSGGFGEGDYVVRAWSMRGGIPAGADTVTFAVSPFHPEFLNTQAEPEMLRRMAQITGGKGTVPDSIGLLADGVHFPKEKRTEVYKILFLNKMFILLIIVILLSSEWLIRKRIGML